ncbi:PREDICTED: pectin acetylesterase 8-like [Ipomoea nil]|uniref:pectin acetylesterase 8-like n=1 Tax=Ipomoea nil TaxID=35883 RepID=UPI000901C685|nr:PREDICTED: pectin acetylesterase 8-like [Ipomoea nil]
MSTIIAAVAAVLLVGLLVTPLNAQLPTTTITNVSISRMKNAMAKGAVCLDGSPPAYYFDEGQGDGIHNWLIYLEGGGWCVSHTDCKSRAQYSLGSSNRRWDNMSFYGIISKNSTENPEFYNWNKVYVVYCDGSSFTGDVDAVDTGNNLTYRGARVFKVIMEELLARGMKSAKNAILSGSSAGGLAAMIHCDYYHELLPKTAKVKCLGIASYFLHQENTVGRKEFESEFEALVTLHGSAKTLHPLCTKLMRPSLCFFRNIFSYM